MKEVLIVNSGRDYKHLNSGDIPVYGTGGYMLSVNGKLSDQDAIGIGRKGTIDKPQYLRAPFWTVDTLFFMIPQINFDLQFLYSMSRKVNWKKLDESTGVPSLSKTVIEKVSGEFPHYQEQIKIGNFFKQLDNTIALHQRKLEALKQLKKGFLQKMFPQEHEKVPEIRFTNFLGNWEQRKLRDISEKVIEKNKNRVFSETFTNSAEYGIILQSDFFDKDISNINNIDGYYVIKPDDFVYNPRISKLAAVGPIKRNKLNRIGVMSPLYYAFRTRNIVPLFLEKYFDTSYWHKFMKLNGDSGARADRFAIKDSVFNKMPIPYPSNEEQVKIGTLLMNLEHTIALHQRKIELLNLIKKSLLQKMFI